MRFISFRYSFVIVPMLLAAFVTFSSAQKSKATGKKQNSKLPAQKKQDSELEQQRKSGLQLISQQNWQNAALMFEQILANYPKDQESNYWLSLAYFNLKRIDEADLKLSALVGELKASGDSRKNLLADSLVLSAVISAVKKDNLAAIEKLKLAVEKVPNHFDANISLGRAYFGEKNFDKATEYFRKAKALRVSDLNARFYLATGLESSGNYQEALSEYRAIIKLDSANPMGNLGLGILLLKSNGNEEEAIAALLKAIKVNENLYEAQIELGKALVKAGRMAESLEHLNKAAALRPGNPEPHFQLSIAYRKLGKKAEAEEEAAIVKKIHESRRGVTTPQ